MRTIILICGIAAALSACDDSHQATLSAPAQPAAAQADTAINAAPKLTASLPALEPAQGDEELTGRSAGAAFSEFVGGLQAKLLATSVTGQLYTGKIKQDISFRALQTYRDDAEAMKSGVEDESQTLGVPRPRRT
jgi:hypothetical protein